MNAGLKALAENVARVACRTRGILCGIGAAVSLLQPAPLAAQMPTVGAVDYFGIRTISPAAVDAAVGIQAGDSVTPGLRNALVRLEAIPGVTRATLDVVCCEEGRSIVYIGIIEAGAASLSFRSEPGGSAALPDAVLEAHRRFEAALAAAMQAGEFAEDDAEGHSLMRFPAARTEQEDFIVLAARHSDALRAVLRESSEARDRAIAAQVLAYYPDKASIVADLAYAARDPAPAVRNNAIRALALVAGFRGRHPEGRIPVPTEPLVALLSSPVWTDRNKSSMALMQVTEARDSGLLHELRAAALPSLVEMARWKTPGHALPALLILGRIASLPDEDIFRRWERGDRESIIEAASQ